MIILPNELEGRYKLIVRRPGGMIRLETDWFSNLITNSGLDSLGSNTTILSGHMRGQDCLTACRVGTGNTPPLVTDTSMTSLVATTTTIQATTQAAVTTPPWYMWKRRTFRFAIGAAAGNIAEVGIFTGSVMFSHALIVDGGGTPTTITILSDEVLDVIYEFRCYPLQADLPFNVTISAVNYSCIARAALVQTNTAGTIGNAIGGVNFTSGGSSITLNTYNGALGAITTVPVGAVGQFADPDIIPAYIAGTYNRTVTYKAALNDANDPAGITAIVAHSFNCTQISFSPPIPKDVTKTLTLDVRYAWSRKVLP